ncbi:MAG: hypothetical protein FJ246_11615 [Nitrospira sp.]|nr:hypothetical protein [Nitrospira sp.]
MRVDDSILLIYPPGEELNFKDHLLEKFVPELEEKGIPHQVVDLDGFVFEVVDPGTLHGMEEDEFDDYRWVKQGLANRIERALVQRLTELASGRPGCAILVHSTMALFPLIRFGEVLRELRHLPARIAIAFPGEDRGGKLHFMNQPDGGNYLAVKIVMM